MNDAATAERADSGYKVRSLISQELPLLRDHLLRLDPESRRDRFNGFTDDRFIERYAEKCASDGTIILAYFETGEVHAAAELHQPDLSSGSLPEIAFSVEAHLRRKGVGSILFERLIAVAKSLGYEKLRITTGAQNQAMRALANKFGAHLTFRSGESTGVIELTEAPSEDESTELPPAAASALIEFNQACWSLFLKMSGIGKAA